MGESFRIASLKDLELSVQEKNDGLQNCEQQKMNLESDLDKKESEIASLTKASGDKATLAKEKVEKMLMKDPSIACIPCSRLNVMN